MVASNNDDIIMLLRILDESKRKAYKQKENEAIQFSFDLSVDRPDEVTKEMVDNGYIRDEDAKAVTKLITDKIRTLKQERELYAKDQLRQQHESERKGEMQDLYVRFDFVLHTSK